MTTQRSEKAQHTATVRLVQACARGAQRRPKTIIAAWLVFVIACLALGSVAGTRSLTDAGGEVGQSARADQLLAKADLRDPAVESVLVQSKSATTTAATVADLAARAGSLPSVARVITPAQEPTLSVTGGRTELVQVTLAGNPDDAGDNVGPLVAAVAAVSRAHAGVSVQQVGAGTESKAINDMVSNGLHKAEMISLPITLIILVLAFGALVAASVPLILGLTAVAAAIGAMGLISHVAPNSSSTSSLVVLIGLAVGVDYSLFYIRREREERRRGHGEARLRGRATNDSALEAAASSVGRAILVSGATVMVALAGLLITGAGDFISMALGTITVVGIAVIGSLTVLPAVLALLGDRVDRGRLPGWRRRAARRARKAAAAGGTTRGVWARLARGVTASPRAALIAAVCVLGTLAVPLLGMHTAGLQLGDLPQDLPVVKAAAAVESAFPGAPDNAQLVVQGHGLGTASATQELAALGQRARAVTGGQGAVSVEVSTDGTLGRVDVPMPQQSLSAQKAIVTTLRHDVAPTASQIDGVHSAALVTGNAASDLDYSARMKLVTPIVIAMVLLLGFVLLTITFRAPLLAAAMMGLSLLSVGAAYGVLIAVFQHTWAESWLGFHATGHITNWLPLFMFVVLFGLSMDYTVLVLERIREARARGLSPRDAAAEGVGATAGTVTSAAFVMVAVFSIFATLDLVTFKQLGVGLAAAVLIDATVVRGIALPAVVAILGERGWPMRGVAPTTTVTQCEDAAVSAKARV